MKKLIVASLIFLSLSSCSHEIAPVVNNPQKVKVKHKRVAPRRECRAFVVAAFVGAVIAIHFINPDEVK